MGVMLPMNNNNEERTKEQTFRMFSSPTQQPMPFPFAVLFYSIFVWALWNRCTFIIYIYSSTINIKQLLFILNCKDDKMLRHHKGNDKDVGRSRCFSLFGRKQKIVRNCSAYPFIIHLFAYAFAFGSATATTTAAAASTVKKYTNLVMSSHERVIIMVCARLGWLLHHFQCFGHHYQHFLIVLLYLVARWKYQQTSTKFV